MLFAGTFSNPYANADKTSVLHEARVFNETPVYVKKCTHVLIKLFPLINQVLKMKEVICCQFEPY